MFLGKKRTEKIETIDLRDYAKFVLKDGSILEQRSILECVNSNLILENNKVELLK